MRSELKFKRAGSIELHVSFACDRYFATVMYGYGGKWEVLASINAVSPINCELHSYADGRWSLSMDMFTTFHLAPSEAQQLQETFGLQVRHIPASDPAGAGLVDDVIKTTEAAGELR